MIHELAYYSVFGLPFLVVMGIITLLCLCATAAIAGMNRRGMRTIPIRWHFTMAKISIALALLHGALGLSVHIV
ncbi:MAG: hypothetical protein APR53_06970 [Methanoculleus sp. SDB]|nr:MAG: hypothetical protein APR53_06970 [Methanoculleus sp. SDB]